MKIGMDREELKNKADELRAIADQQIANALAKAEAARAEGKEAKAEKYEEKASQIIAPQLAPTVDKGSVSVKKLYSVEVYDLMALVKAVAEGKAPLPFIEANLTLLNAQARSLKESMKYPGVKVICEDSLSSRR